MFCFFLIIRASEQTGYLFLAVLLIQVHLRPSPHGNPLEKCLIALFWKSLYQTAWFSWGLFFKSTIIYKKKPLSIFRMINTPFWIAKQCHNLISSLTYNCTGIKENRAGLIVSAMHLNWVEAEWHHGPLCRRMNVLQWFTQTNEVGKWIMAAHVVETLPRRHKPAAEQSGRW